MRKSLFALAVLAGAAGLGGTADAAPFASAPAFDAPAHVQTVQYYGRDWRAREYWRHRRHEEWRRREAWRHHEWRRHGLYRPHTYAGPGS